MSFLTYALQPVSIFYKLRQAHGYNSWAPHNDRADGFMKWASRLSLRYCRRPPPFCPTFISNLSSFLTSHSTRRPNPHPRQQDAMKVMIEWRVSGSGVLNEPNSRSCISFIYMAAESVTTNPHLSFRIILRSVNTNDPPLQSTHPPSLHTHAARLLSMFINKNCKWIYPICSRLFICLSNLEKCTFIHIMYFT